MFPRAKTCLAALARARLFRHKRFVYWINNLRQIYRTFFLRPLVCNQVLRKQHLNCKRLCEWAISEKLLRFQTFLSWFFRTPRDCRHVSVRSNLYQSAIVPALRRYGRPLRPANRRSRIDCRLSYAPVLLTHLLAFVYELVWWWCLTHSRVRALGIQSIKFISLFTHAYQSCWMEKLLLEDTTEERLFMAGVVLLKSSQRRRVHTTWSVICKCCCSTQRRFTVLTNYSGVQCIRHWKRKHWKGTPKWGTCDRKGQTNFATFTDSVSVKKYIKHVTFDESHSFVQLLWDNLSNLSSLVLIGPSELNPGVITFFK